MSNSEIIQAFETMWGTFPEPVLLLHKDRTIVALNDLGKQSGVLVVGDKCYATKPGRPRQTCRGCLAKVSADQAGSATLRSRPTGYL